MNSDIEKTFVKFDKIDKSYDGEVLVVKNLNLDIALELSFLISLCCQYVFKKLKVNIYC